MSTNRTTFRMTDKRAMLFERASDIVAKDELDDPPTSDVMDAALTHLIESYQNLEAAREEHPPHIVQDCLNTSVIGLKYRTRIEKRWR